MPFVLLLDVYDGVVDDAGAASGVGGLFEELSESSSGGGESDVSVADFVVLTALVTFAAFVAFLAFVALAFAAALIAIYGSILRTLKK